MLRFFSQPLAVILLAVLLSGCGRFTASPPPPVKITVEYPGARPSVVEDVICKPILQQLLGIEGGPTITCVSRAGRAEIYVQVKRAMDADMLVVLVQNRTALAIPVLPDKVRTDGVKVAAGSAVPRPVAVHEVDFPVVDVDREKAARLGISLSTVSDALGHEVGANEPGPDLLQRLDKLTFKANNGEDHYLREFATLRIVREPNIRILREPPDEEGGQ